MVESRYIPSLSSLKMHGKLLEKKKRIMNIKTQTCMFKKNKKWVKTTHHEPFLPRAGMSRLKQERMLRGLSWEITVHYVRCNNYRLCYIVMYVMF